MESTPQAWLRGIVQPVKKFALAGLAFRVAKGSRMRRNIHSDSLATEFGLDTSKELIKKEQLITEDNKRGG